jgi:NitT/TauT family transport system ATP-binding protein
LLGTGGNAITVSLELWRAMQQAGAGISAAPVRQAAALADVVKARAAGGQPPLTLAMVFPFSCHNYQLRDWLESGGIDPDRDVRLVVLPPPLLVDALRSGQVDGFCVGEPWNSLAVEAGIGVIAAVASDVWPTPPEKVVAMRARYADENPEVVARLVRALHGAAQWAADAGNRADLAQLLAQPRYVGAPARLLLAALNCSLRFEPGADAVDRPGFLSLDSAAIAPRRDHAALILSRMQRWGQVAANAAGLDEACAAFLGEGFEKALRETGVKQS